MKTNAMRLLDKEKIEYSILSYDVEVGDDFGKRVADVLGRDLGSCFKTLALKHDHDLFLCCIPVDKELDLKKAVKQIGVKDLVMVHVRDLLRVVGYARGSVSPIGARKNSGVYFDVSVLDYDKIELSGGMCGVGLLVDRCGLLTYLGAEVRDLCQ